MAFIPVSQDEFNCSICLDLLKDPVTVPCGHSFCLNCITGCWDQDEQKGVYSCPQCRQTFAHRPVLGRSTMLTEVVEKLKKTEFQSDENHLSIAGPGDVECDFCTGRKHKAQKSCLTCMGSYCEDHIQPHYEVPCLKKHKLVNAISQLQEKICSQHDRLIEVFCHTDQKLICLVCSMDDHAGHKTVSAAKERAEKEMMLLEKKQEIQTQIQITENKLQALKQALEALKASAKKAIEDNNSFFTQIMRFMEQKRCEVTELIRAQERAEVSRAEGLLEQLEMEITTLKNRDAEMEKFQETEDDIGFLKNFDSCCAPSVSKSVSITITTPNLSFTGIKTPDLVEIRKMWLSLNQGFKIGDRVRVMASVEKPKHGWGKINHRSVGVIKTFSSHELMKVEFPGQPDWSANPLEMEQVL